MLSVGVSIRVATTSSSYRYVEDVSSKLGGRKARMSHSWLVRVWGITVVISNGDFEKYNISMESDLWPRLPDYPRL